MSKTNKRRYWVIPMTSHRLKVVDKDYVKEHNRAIKGRGQKDNLLELEQMAFYVTPLKSLTEVK